MCIRKAQLSLCLMANGRINSSEEGGNGMSSTKKPTPALVIGLIFMTALVVLAVVLGVNVIRLSQLTAIEAATTPTPEPEAANVMQVTIDPNEPTPEPVLRAGSSGDAVIELQTRLQALGYYSGEIDGQYGAGTKAAVKLFQQQNGLDADGLFGGDTRKALFADDAQAYVSPTDTPAPTDTATIAPEEGTVVSFDEEAMPLLVNADHMLPEDYEPDDLVNMTDYCDASVVKIKANGIDGVRVAVDALMEMLRAAQAEGISSWQVSAGYRSVSYQQKLLDNKIYEYRKQGKSASAARAAALKLVALPGGSEHHTGLAFDITVPGQSFKGTKQCTWLAEHCWEYGFIIRYTAEKESITGITEEPWHIRYVGIKHALIMRDENLCLEEYVEQYGDS